MAIEGGQGRENNGNQARRGAFIMGAEEGRQDPNIVTVFNSRTRIVEENLYTRFSESTPDVVCSGQDWLFDIEALTRTITYEPIVADTQSNGL
nr:hypothetical protein [Tanacetum cinerariifolium]